MVKPKAKEPLPSIVAPPYLLQNISPHPPRWFQSTGSAWGFEPHALVEGTPYSKYPLFGKAWFSKVNTSSFFSRGSA